MTETINVNFSVETAWRLETESQNADRPPSSDLAASAASGSSTMMLSHSIARPIARPPTLPDRAAVRGRRLRRRVLARRGGGLRAHFAVDTPLSSSILATEPVSRSKRSLLIFFQPPKSSTVFSVPGSGNLSLFLLEHGR